MSQAFQEENHGNHHHERFTGNGSKQPGGATTPADSAPTTAGSLTAPAPSRRSIAGRVSRALWYLDYADLCSEARKRTALDDFGDPSLTPALPLLLDSLEQEAGLSPHGRFLMRIHLRDLLATRLRLSRVWKQNHEVMELQSLEKPVFIVGMPRSGSTYLHELLAADPEHRAARVWEIMYPMAAGDGDVQSRQRHIRKAESCLWWFRRLAPHPDSVYPMRACTPHECVAIHSYTFMSQEFVSTCRIPGYEAFLRSADLSQAYHWEKRFLQYLQLGTGQKRWILKSPDHVHGLEPLFAVFPDAFLVQTHRNPIEVLKSSADLTRVLHSLYGTAASPDETLARETRQLAANTERFIQFRDRHPELAHRIIDVKYSDILADPLGTVRMIYDRLQANLDEPRLQSLSQLAASRTQYRGRRASAEPFRAKFNVGAELSTFERYCLRFGLPFQGVE